MAAYEMVAQTVGTSADWIRRFVNETGSEAKEPKWSIGWNLIEYCNRVLSARVEQEIEKERLKIETLKREFDALTEPVSRVVENATRAKAPRTRR
jgi:alpha-glucosidase (family GH31 glycosyl hydrolase)